MGLKKFIRKVAPYAGPIIGAAASLIGGSKSNKANRRNAAQEYERQKEFAQMGVRWKVADAKAAGLHPLFALGAQTPSYNPVSVQDSMGPALSEAGQNIGRAVASTLTSHEREMQALQMRLARQQIEQGDLTNEGLRLQNRQLENDLLLAPITMPTFSPPEIDFGGGEGDAARRQMATQYQTPPGDSSVAVGDTPLWRVFSIGNGRQMVLPGGMSGDAAEVLESLADSPSIMLAVLEENRQRYGSEFADWMYDRYFKTPLRRVVESVGGVPGRIARHMRFKNYSRNAPYTRRPDSGKRWKQMR